MTGKQELALELVKVAHRDWQHAHDTILDERRNMQLALKRAVDAGISQSVIADAVGWPRQRVHTILHGGR